MERVISGCAEVRCDGSALRGDILQRERLHGHDRRPGHRSEGRRGTGMELARNLSTKPKSQTSKKSQPFHFYFRSLVKPQVWDHGEIK